LGITIKITKRGLVKVKSKILRKNPMLELTIEQYNNIKDKNILSISVPNEKLSFNEWAKKLTPYNMFDNFSN